VIVADADDGKLRQCPVALERAELLEPDIDTALILDPEIERRKTRMHQPGEPRHVGAHLAAGPRP
jgi:hypothetical protein